MDLSATGRKDGYARNEYLKVLRGRYFESRAKKEKSQILDEYCSNASQSREYVIRKIHRADLRPMQRKKRKEIEKCILKSCLLAL